MKNYITNGFLAGDLKRFLRRDSEEKQINITLLWAADPPY